MMCEGATRLIILAGSCHFVAMAIDGFVKKYSSCSFGNIIFRKAEPLHFQTAAWLGVWGDHRAVTHCTCRQGRLGFLASLMMIVIRSVEADPPCSWCPFCVGMRSFGGEGGRPS